MTSSLGQPGKTTAQQMEADLRDLRRERATVVGRAAKAGGLTKEDNDRIAIIDGQIASLEKNLPLAKAAEAAAREPKKT